MTHNQIQNNTSISCRLNNLLYIDTTPFNGNTYTWSPAAGLSGTTTSDVIFGPTAAGSYTFTVEATSESG